MRPFADVLEEIADQAKVYDVLDAAVRGAKRRRKARVIVRPLVAVAVVVALVACSGLVLGQFMDRFGGVGRPEPGPGRLGGDPPALVQPLLDSPTRGTLAESARRAPGRGRRSVNRSPATVSTTRSGSTRTTRHPAAPSPAA